MNGNQFDEFFRNKLGDYSSQVPEGMWERIKPKEDKDRKIIFFWICYVIIPASLLLTFAGSYFIGQKQTTQYSKRPDKPSTPTNNSSTPLNNSLVLKETTYSKEIAATLKTNAHTRTPYIAAVHASGNQPNLPSTNPSYHKRAAATHSKNPLLPPTSEPAPISPGIANNPSIVHATSIIDSTSFKDTVHLNTYPVPDSANRSVASHKQAEQPPAQVPDQSHKTSKPSSPARPDWYLDGYASPDLPFNSLHANDPVALQFAKKAQRLQLSYTTGLKLSRSFGKHFSATIGLQYSRINEKFQFDSLSPIVYNHFNSIDIPLLIGYTTGNDHFRAAVNAGVIYNANSWYQSTSADSTVINYKTNTGISLYLGLNLAKKVNDRISLFAEPYYRYRLSNITYDKQPVRRKINSAGISIGLRYNLSKPRKRK